MKGSAGFQPAVAGILAGNILHNGPLALGVNVDKCVRLHGRAVGEADSFPYKIPFLAKKRPCWLTFA
jgi:hypothetical protein